MSRKPHVSLVFRLYAVSVAQLVLVAAAVVLVGALIGRPPRPPFPPHDGIADARGPIGPRPTTSGDFVRRQHGFSPPSPLMPLITFFGFGIVILAVGAFLTARSILRPLSELSRAAQALGAGDLRVRAGLTRADELGDLGRAFDEMAERVQRLLHTEKELLANVSHELKTPLARIRVALDIAAEGGPDAARSSLAEIAVDLSELEAIIEDILTATRLQLVEGSTGAALPLRLTRVSPEQLAQQAAQRFRSLHPERPLTLDVERGLADVRADPVLFRRVLDNLLENAHKYCPDPARPIRLGAESADARIRFQVQDQGMGIASADLPRLFSAFFRGERSRSRAAGGVGLGLTLVKQIVDAHAGTVHVESDAYGSRFSVELPLAAPS